MRPKLILLFLLISPFYRVLGQEFKGYVKKADSTSSPIFQASIEVKEGDKPPLIQKTYFDGSFKFSLQKNQTYLVKVFYSGYSDTSYSINTNKNAVPSAQNITVKLKKDGMRLMGKILSREEDFPIKGATIVLKNVMTRQEDRITTDIDGRYNFKLEYETNYKVWIDKRAPGIFNVYKDTSFYISTIGFNMPLDYKLDIKLDPMMRPTTTVREGYDATKKAANKNLKPVVDVVNQETKSAAIQENRLKPVPDSVARVNEKTQIAEQEGKKPKTQDTISSTQNKVIPGQSLSAEEQSQNTRRVKRSADNPASTSVKRKKKKEKDINEKEIVSSDTTLLPAKDPDRVHRADSINVESDKRPAPVQVAEPQGVGDTLSAIHEEGKSAKAKVRRAGQKTGDIQLNADTVAVATGNKKKKRNNDLKRAETAQVAPEITPAKEIVKEQIPDSSISKSNGKGVPAQVAKQKDKRDTLMVAKKETDSIPGSNKTIPEKNLDTKSSRDNISVPADRKKKRKEKELSGPEVVVIRDNIPVTPDKSIKSAEKTAPLSELELTLQKALAEKKAREIEAKIRAMKDAEEKAAIATKQKRIADSIELAAKGKMLQTSTADTKQIALDSIAKVKSERERIIRELVNKNRQKDSLDKIKVQAERKKLVQDSLARTKAIELQKKNEEDLKRKAAKAEMDRKAREDSLAKATIQKELILAKQKKLADSLAHAKELSQKKMDDGAKAKPAYVPKTQEELIAAAQFFAMRQKFIRDSIEAAREYAAKKAAIDSLAKAKAK